ncbi:tyrosine-type recombinase/integrase [Gordonia sp. MP11Mi]|uniref:Defective protein IntQ n=1 Tax=Gordonia sp. MP11Mi TaxID=3022769 RepID=A0AA97CWK5_9ACTN
MRVPVDPEDPDAGSRFASGGGFLTADAADDALDDAKRKLRQRIKFARDVPTVATYVGAWIDGRQLERSTVAGYKRLTRNHITPQLGEITLDKLTATRIAKHYRQLAKDGRRDGSNAGKPLSANTIAKVHAVLAAALDAAVSEGYIAVNPARKRDIVQPPTGRAIRSQRPEMQVWTAAQLNAFLSWSRDTYDDPMYPLWAFIAHTGVRRSEALALRWADVDMKHGRVSIRRALDTTQRGVVKLTKSAGARVVDVDADTVSLLKSWRKTLGKLSLERMQADAYVFGNLRDGSTRSPNEVSRRWRTRVEAARGTLDDELPTIRLHDLRHTHASLLLALGVPVKVVSERLGHASATITLDVYSHVLPGQGREAAELLAAAVRSPS